MNFFSLAAFDFCSFSGVLLKCYTCTLIALICNCFNPDRAADDFCDFEIICHRIFVNFLSLSLFLISVVFHLVSLIAGLSGW